MLHVLGRFMYETGYLFNEMAIYLLMGFLLGGLIHAFLPTSWIRRAIGTPGLSASFKAALWGVPLPLCSCGVVPTALAIRQAGGSRGATVSFLIATPQTGVDSIAATASMLGPVFAVFRPVVAFVTGCIGGAITDQVAASSEADFAPAKADPTASSRMSVRLVKALRYGFDTLLGDLARWIVLGLAIGGAIAAVLPDGFFVETVRSPVLVYGTMLLVSVPIYVCATGSIPVAMALVMKGLSPGAAFVFLMAGPATNAASLTVLWNTLGRRTTWVFLLTIVLGAVGGGVVLDRWLQDAFVTSFAAMHHAAMPWLVWTKRAGSVVLAILLARVWVRRWIGSRNKSKEAVVTGKDMRTLVVRGMTCNHCKARVEQAAKSVPGVTGAVADPASDSLQVIGEADLDAVRRAVESAGYTVD